MKPPYVTVVTAKGTEVKAQVSEEESEEVLRLLTRFIGEDKPLAASSEERKP